MSDEQYKLAFMQTYAKSFYEVLKTMKTSNLVGAPEFETATITFTFSEVPTEFVQADDVVVTGGTLSTITFDDTGKVGTAIFTPILNAVSAASITSSKFTVEITNNFETLKASETSRTKYPPIPLHKMMAPEQIQLTKKFGENKGSKIAIEYVNNLIESLNTAPLVRMVKNLDTDLPEKESFKKIPFKIETVDLFWYKAQGNLSKEAFEQFVKPLAHPVGFIYEYEQGPNEVENLKDKYNFRIKYNIAALTILFANEVKTYSYLENGYNVVDIVHEIIPFLNTDFKGNFIVQNELLLRITFENGNYLDQRTRFNKTTVIEYYANGEIKTDYSQDNDNVYVNIEYIEDDTFFPDFNILTDLEFNESTNEARVIRDANQIPIYGEAGLIYTSEELNDPNWEGKYKFTYGFGTTKLELETVQCDDYINIRNYCRDSNIDFKIEIK
jgi:hypothetical protein